MRKITRIEPTVPSIKHRKKVAAYSRVSRGSGDYKAYFSEFS